MFQVDKSLLRNMFFSNLQLVDLRLTLWRQTVSSLQRSSIHFGASGTLDCFASNFKCPLSWLSKGSMNGCVCFFTFWFKYLKLFQYNWGAPNNSWWWRQKVWKVESWQFSACLTGMGGVWWSKSGGWLNTFKIYKLQQEKICPLSSSEP